MKPASSTVGHGLIGGSQRILELSMAIDMDTQNDALGKGWKGYQYVLSKVAVEYPDLR